MVISLGTLTVVTNTLYKTYFGRERELTATLARPFREAKGK